MVGCRGRGSGDSYHWPSECLNGNIAILLAPPSCFLDWQALAQPWDAVLNGAEEAFSFASLFGVKSFGGVAHCARCRNEPCDCGASFRSENAARFIGREQASRFGWKAVITKRRSSLDKSAETTQESVSLAGVLLSESVVGCAYEEWCGYETAESVDVVILAADVDGGRDFAIGEVALACVVVAFELAAFFEFHPQDERGWI